MRQQMNSFIMLMDMFALTGSGSGRYMVLLSYRVQRGFCTGPVLHS